METNSGVTQEQVLKQTGRSLFDFGTRTRPMGKFFVVLILILGLMIPLRLVSDQVSSRARLQREVTEEIANTAASSQTVIGPILAVYYRTKTPEKYSRDEKSGKTLMKEASISEHLAYIPAKKLAIEGSTDVESRYRGIYQAKLFHLNAKVEGVFESPANMIRIPDGETFVDAHAAILFSVADPRGLDSDPDVLVDGTPLRFNGPTNKLFSGVMTGSRLEINLGAWKPGQARTMTFSFPLKLTGTETLSIAPTAENNIVKLVSHWKHPSFGGRFLPRERTIEESGFTAQWEISQLARNLERALNGTPRQEDIYERNYANSEVLEVRFIDPVNIYLQAERAVKYGILFIVLTFAAFFIGETLRRRPMHIMQYALVGLSLAIFFLLLIALSEHLSFGLAYLVGAVACIGLITIYLAGVFGSWRMATSFGGGLAILYGMLFGILQLEDMALLMGSLLLFAALTVVMLSTRRFDWYQLKQGETTDVDKAPSTPDAKP